MIVARNARAKFCWIVDVRGLIGTAHLDPRALAPSLKASIVCAACERRWPLAGKEGRVQFSFSAAFWERALTDISPGALEQPGMTINVTRRAALVGLSTCIAVPVRAQTTSRPKDAADSVTLEQPAVFDIAANTGSLKETVQKGQQLVAPERGTERRRLSSEQYFDRVPAQRKRGAGENDVLRQRFVSRLSQLRRGKIERHRSCQRRRIAPLLELRYFRQVRRQGPAAHATDARRPNRHRCQCLHQCQHR